MTGRRAEERSRGTAVDAFLEPLLEALAKAKASDRHRLLGSWVVELAQHSQDGTGRGGASADQLEELTKKVQRLDREKADLEDALKTTQADLARREKQFEAEQTRAEELQQILNEQRERMETVQKEHADLDEQVVARNAEIHRLESERDELLLKVQRAELAAGDDTRTDAAEAAKRELGAEIESLRAELDQLREEKNAEIDKLSDEKNQLAARAAKGADALLLTVWDRLASAKPPLSQGGIQPETQAADLLVDTFIELGHFAAKLDDDMRLFLGKYSKHHPAVNRPWQVYASRDDFLAMIEQTIQPSGTGQIGAFRMKLKAFGRFMFAAMVSCDTVIESIASELQAQLMGDQFAGADPNCRIRDYLKHDGHELFMEHMLKLRADRMAKVFGSST